MIKKEELLSKLKKERAYTVLVKKALKQAEISHGKDKRDDGGGVLENHIFPIAYSVLERYKQEKFLEDLVVLALLHDTMEDDEDFNEEVCLKSFNKEVCENVKKLTKNTKRFKNRKNYNENLYELSKYFSNKEYIENVNGANEVCKIVKLEDRLNNLQSIEDVGADLKNLRYVMESDTLFIAMAKRTISFNYVPLLEEEIKRLSS